MRTKLDLFIFLLIVVVILASIGAEVATEYATLLTTIISVGITGIFFLYGLKLDAAKILQGLRNYRLHLLVQASTFLIFPLLVLAGSLFFETAFMNPIWIAFYFLAVLPSTVSSSVVMVALAKGNLPAAIFNASLSGFVGILVTPLWMQLVGAEAQLNADLGDLYLKLVVQIITPVLAGMALQKHLGKLVQKYTTHLAWFDKSIILLVVFQSFSKAFAENTFNGVSAVTLALIFIAVLVLFFLMYSISGAISKSLHFSREDRITAQYCGTKKSLVHGVVFSKILFPGLSASALLLLPLMLFHAVQLIFISVFASSESRALSAD